MPAARTSDQPRIEVALAALQRALSELDARWMVIGGIAVIAHGVQRMTTDIDAVIRGDVVAIHAALNEGSTVTRPLAYRDPLISRCH